MKHILIAIAAIMLVVGSLFTVRAVRRMKLGKSLVSLVILIVLCSCGGLMHKDKEKLSECNDVTELIGDRVLVPDSLIMGGFIVRCLDDKSAVIRYFGRPFILGYLSFEECSVQPPVVRYGYGGRFVPL